MKGLASSQGDSHVKTLAEPGPERACLGIDPVFGRKCSELLEKFGQNGSLLKMPAPCEVMGLRPSCKIYGRSGSMRNGILYQQPALVPHINGKERGLLQTPTVEDAKRQGSQRAWVKYLQEKHTSSCRLRNQAAFLDEKDGYLNPEWIGLLMMYPAGWAKLAATEMR